MKRLAMIVAAATLLSAVPTWAQFDFRVDDSWQRQIDRSRELEAQRLERQRQEDTERRLQEVERRQRIDDQRRLDAQRHNSNPFISERQRRLCAPGQIFC